MVLALTASNCNEAKHPMKMHITNAENGKSVTAKTGSALTVSLPENPTTGYRWALDNVDTSLLTVQSDDYIPPSTTAVGGGGLRTITLTINQAGNTNLKLKLWREWEGESSVQERFSLHLTLVP